MRLRAGDAREYKVPAARHDDGLRLHPENIRAREEQCRGSHRAAVRNAEGGIARREPPRACVLELPLRLRKHEDRAFP